MLWYIARRVAETIPVIIGVLILGFILLVSVPGDPALILAGEQAPPQVVEMIRYQFGLDLPVHERLFVFIRNTFQGNLGFSYVFGRPVLEVTLERLPATILLVGTGLTLGLVLGIIAGVVSARRLHSPLDNGVMVFALFGYSIPIFWLSQLLILGFSVYLGWFPVSGMVDLRENLVGVSYVTNVIWHLVLPALSLSIIFLGATTRLTRSAILEVLRSNYIITARAKGLKESQVFYRHALRNALLPIVTYAGFQFGLVIGGTVLVETVYAWPGAGRLMYDAIFNRDLPVLLGMFVFLTLSVIIVQLITDVVYAYLDPRITYR